MNLLDIINFIKVEASKIVRIYISRVEIGDIQSAKHQREVLIALDIHLTCLKYWSSVTEEEKANLSIKEEDVYNCAEAAVSCVRTFKPFYYE